MARRRDDRRSKRRRRKGSGAGVVLTFFVLILVLSAVISAMILFFEIKSVTVTGETRYSKISIIEAAQIEIGYNMFLFNKFACYNRIFDAHPYLDEIAIRRRLPDEVEIIVTECQPVAVLRNGLEEYYIIDGKGKLLERITEKDLEGCVLIEGVELEEPIIGKYSIFVQPEKEKPLFTLLNRAMDNGILPNVGAIDITEAYGISFTYLDRFTVSIGTVDDLEQKIRFMRQIIEEELAANDRGVIDVSDIRTARFRPYK